MAQQFTRREAIQAAGILAGATCSGLTAGLAAESAAIPARSPRLRAAAIEFAITPEAGIPSDSRFTNAAIQKVASPLKTTLTLLEDGDLRLCLITSHFNWLIETANVAKSFRRIIAEEMQLPTANVLMFASHNHCDLELASNRVEAYHSHTAVPDGMPEPKLLPIGRQLLDQMRSHARRLPDLLQPATVWWGEGIEGRITYNRKGRRADGSTYFMREEDRELVGRDFNGDIDRQAPIVVLKNTDGKPIVALLQFTGHPVTSYRPENPIVFGEWPQVACDVVAEHLQPGGSLPVGFMQGCAGDVNSKEMFRGGVERSTQFGNMLGESYIKAVGNLVPSRRDGLNYAVVGVQIPFSPLPSEDQLRTEIVEMEDFIRRAAAGDDNTRACVGLNFPRELSPAYRGKLVEAILPWNRWALDLRQTGRADTVPHCLETEIYVLRIGDVGIVGMPFEPFQGIGRQIRKRSPLPLAIPCGYVNLNYGYLTDSANTGDREYMSAFYRYTKFLPAYAKPAGDVLADKGVETLNQFAGGNHVQ
jgi:hypothetical protein